MGRVAAIAAVLAAGGCDARTQGTAPAEPRSTAAPSHDRWMLFAHTAMAEAHLERVLYERPGAPHFYVRVRITNRTGGELGIATSEYFGVIYPNQWGASPTPHR